MIKGEKVYSYVKFEHEIEPTYREKIALAKKRSEVKKILFETLKILLTKVDEIFENLTPEDVNFDGENLKFSKKWQEEIEKFSKNSDLNAIIQRITEAAIHRIKKIENDENTDYFNIKTK
ncbi:MULTISPECIES: hypothetical protein [unclassified Thermosipho (in: thermotogales)]|uniref:hypothetical protein n=1 Tax=unclassified Thermosipho (in: thermotogales) TaxID=2676525 RepID=UPI0009872ABD|nr:MULTISPECIES: hypothetical protein [unclassified Thermosipho (in: thermotogales)]MBT1248504.1 hypothetical protein [Thermosipho sp. 1244]OOC47275.1 hypothetical protein XO09_02445 [Thermosipho sp. 1223]